MRAMFQYVEHPRSHPRRGLGNNGVPFVCQPAGHIACSTTLANGPAPRLLAYGCARSSLISVTKSGPKESLSARREPHP
jgi:hypothetical protein